MREDIGVESVVCRSAFIDWIKEHFPGHKKEASAFQKSVLVALDFFNISKKGTQNLSSLGHIFLTLSCKRAVYLLYILPRKKKNTMALLKISARLHKEKRRKPIKKKLYRLIKQGQKLQKFCFA